MQLYQERKLRHVFSCKFSEIFKKTYFVEHVRTDAWVKWTKNIVFTKSIHREIPVMESFLVQLIICGLIVFSKSDSITDAFLWKFEVLQNIIFTEQCCATAADFQWCFQRITCFISDKVIAWRYNMIFISVSILVLYYYISIILVLILVFYYYISITIVVLIF